MPASDHLTDMKKYLARSFGLIMAVALVLSGCGGSEASLDLSELGQQGQDISRDRGCAACHGENGEGTVGPAWAGLVGSTVTLEGGGTAFVDTEFLRRAIVDPAAEILEGATIAMPVSQLTEDEIVALIAFIEELQ